MSKVFNLLRRVCEFQVHTYTYAQSRCLHASLADPREFVSFWNWGCAGVLQMRLLRRAYLLPSASTQAQPIYGFRLLASSGSEKTCKMIALGPHKFLLCSQFPA
jgi:hypothetical protein